MIDHFYGSIRGCFTFAEFYAFVAQEGRLRGVEVGALEGQSAACLAVEMINRFGGQLDLVELSSHRGLLESNLSTVREVIGAIHSPMSSVDASRLYAEESLTFVMLDGDHSLEGVRADIAAWWPKVAKNGILATHDFSHYFPGIIRAWNETFSSYNMMRGSAWPDEHVKDSRLPEVRADFQNRSAHKGDTDYLPVAWVRK